MKIRKITRDDFPKILAFADIYLRRDWLIRKQYLTDRINDCIICESVDGKLLGFGIISPKTKTLINLIVHPKFRGQGIGKKILKFINPQIIHSKANQSTGDPKSFYLKNGYEIDQNALSKKSHIEILKKIER